MIVRAFVVIPALLLCLGCKSSSKESSASGVASQVAPVQPSARASGSAIPTVSLPSEAVEKVVNPSGLSPYNGPVGTIKGVVRVSGESSPEITELKKRIPLGKCFEAHKRYGSVYREGPGRTLADVLVAVTEYDGFLQARAPTVTLPAKGCAFATRTVAMTYGQQLAVKNEGRETYTPQLIGVRTQALLLAIPGGKPIHLLPPKPGRFKLIDRSHEFATADVFVLAYPTTDVTGLDGRFEITGIPVGEVQLSALLPRTGGKAAQRVVVKADETVEVDLTITFDADRFKVSPDSAGK